MLTDGTFVVAESMVVSEYLAQKYGRDAGVDLLPGTPRERAYHTIFIEQALSKYVAQFYGTMMERDPDERQKKFARYLELAAKVAAAYAVHGGPFLLGERMTLADIYLYPFIERWAMLEHYHGLSIPEHAPYMELFRFRQAMEARSAVQRTRKPREFFIAAYADRLKKHA